MHKKEFVAFFRRVVSFDDFQRAVIAPYGTYACARTELLGNPSKEALVPSLCSRLVMTIEGYYRLHGY